MVYRIEQVDGIRAYLSAVVKGPERVVYYIIRVEHGVASWSVSRRYSDFYQLWLALQRHWEAIRKCECQADIVPAMPSFPKKRIFRSSSLAMSRYESFRGFLKLIMIILQDTLCELDNSCPATVLLRRFLMIDKAQDNVRTMPLHEYIRAEMASERREGVSSDETYGHRMSSRGYQSLEDQMDVDMMDDTERVRLSVPAQLDPGANFRVDRYKGGNLDLSMSMDSYALNVIEEGRQVIRHFLETSKCYDVIKDSGKVVVFDVKIPMNLAFFALVEHHIKSVPLWDADQGCFVGMFTSTDFVNILRHFYGTGAPMNAAAEHSIASWKALSLRMNLLPPTHSHMLYVTPEDSLMSALLMLRQHQLHRLAILDTEQNSVLSIITHFGILEYLVSTFREQRRLFDQSILELGIGTFSNLITMPEDTPLINVLHTLMERRISAVPIVDASGNHSLSYCDRS
ncbi:5'-AMP-activated protein kinase subunit gamma [Thraustotheca clavata]|uniref:5'-AMP-activated protein kinase subunit gamma n=1 Tax=Thraustotheca clavata TaxID=74557 RepID=A0A1V9Y6G2_9STRA|nr:5'-AMP-activated protein kinase subunit gamma [Thraustotheca clavata]